MDKRTFTLAGPLGTQAVFELGITDDEQVVIKGIIALNEARAIHSRLTGLEMQNHNGYRLTSTNGELMVTNSQSSTTASYDSAYYHIKELRGKVDIKSARKIYLILIAAGMTERHRIKKPTQKQPRSQILDYGEFENENEIDRAREENRLLIQIDEEEQSSWEHDKDLKTVMELFYGIDGDDSDDGDIDNYWNSPGRFESATSEIQDQVHQEGDM
jgi:hypothetical protein